MAILEKIRTRYISITTTIIQTLKKMDDIGVKMLFVYDNENFISIITIGDIQRSIIKGVNMNTPIKAIIDINKKFALPTESKDVVCKKMLQLRTECMPIVDMDGKLVDVYFWDEMFDGHKTKKEKLKLPVVIMAGGKGTRLLPLTNIYPKPLIPIGEKTIVESIMDKFVGYGCQEFYISINYKADTIKNYFQFIDNPNYQIKYFQEDRPMGTAGSLRLLKDTLTTTFFVSNCDILIEEDYSSILKYHRNSQNELTVVAAVKTFSIPYGTISTGKDGLLENIEEKPTLSFKINTGLYILEPSLLNDIPDKFFHITNLIEKLKLEGRRVGVYPISQNDWKDMGDWDEYLKMINIK